MSEVALDVTFPEIDEKYSVTVNVNTTVEMTKMLVSESSGYAPDLFVLVFEGSQLNDSKNIFSCGVSPGGEIMAERSRKGRAVYRLGNDLTQDGFVSAVNNGDAERVADYLDAGLSAEEEGTLTSGSPLYRAILRAGRYAETTGPNRETALKVAKTILLHPAPLYFYGDGCRSPLNIACEFGDNDVVKLILAHPKSDRWINEVDICGYGNPLYVSCYFKKLPVVRTLLKVPMVNVNYESSRGTSLSIAASRGEIDICRALLDHPKININKCSPLALATKAGHHEVCRLLCARQRSYFDSSVDCALSMLENFCKE
eukprot:TRINITY_DN21496_c0_g1_i1.p1 TRINITY_DN21496_c0_g1~~TRINITY_DN21496_c0_g1_i1.p1  ORF type:complete len:314 (+),score=51.63 TRINITY_DN21496_c0_g1_i1:175-1116(+)